MRACCSRRWWRVRSTSASAIASWPRRTATRSRCWSCRAGRTPAELAGGFGLNGGPVLSGRIEERFQQRLAELPPVTRLLLLVAAAEPIGDPLLLWKAAAALGIDASAGAPAAEAGLVELGAQVRFRHPLVRSAVYGAAATEDRRRVHQALAEATDAGVDPDRRAWHRAQATAGLDEDVAAELERSAARAAARGGVAAGAAFHERAAELTPDPARRARRALVAAQCKHQAGAADEALRLLAMAQAGPLDELDSARAQLLHAQITFATTRGRDAPPLLLEAAKRLEPLDSTLARGTYLDAFAAALSADRLVRGGDAREIAAAVLAADWEPCERACDLLLDGLALVTTEGYAAGAPALKEALRAFREEPDLRGGGAALAVAGLPRRPRPRRRRGLGRAHRAPGRARAPDRGAVRAADRLGRSAPRGALLRPARLRDRAGRRGGRRGGGDRQRRRAARRDRARQLARAGCGGAGAGRGRPAGRVAARRGALARRHRLGQRGPLQRPRPLRRGPGRGRAGRRGPARARHADVAAGRPHRGGRPGRQAGARGRPARAAGGDRRGQRHRLGARLPRPLAGAADRGGSRRAAVPRGGRARRPHAHPRRARPDAAGLRRVAAAREPPRGRPRAAPGRAHDAVRDRHGGLRRARPARAAGDGGDGAQAHGRDARRPDAPGAPDRAAGGEAAAPTRRSGRSCSSARAPSSGTCARCSASSASARARSCARRCPRVPRSP